MRYAVYFTPPRDDALTRAAEAWLGRSAFGDAPVAVPHIPELMPEEIEAMVREPRRYGFHATMVAPFRLADGRDETQLLAAFARFCADAAPFAIEGLTVARLSSFVALTPREREHELSDLAARAVHAFAPFRAPLTPDEIARRRPESLTARQAAYLERYGYPYVIDEFRFHMTLTGSLAPEAMARVQPLLADHFAPVLVAPMPIGGLALFQEAEPGAPLTILDHARLSGGEARKSA